jgi:hypothetical protein
MLQEIITRRCDHLLSEIISTSVFNNKETIFPNWPDSSACPSVSQLQSFPRIWISLVKCLLLLPELEIKWKTIQSLQTILKTVHWFYSYGSPPSTAAPAPACDTLPTDAAAIATAMTSSSLPLPNEEIQNNDEKKETRSHPLLMPWDEFVNLQKVENHPCIHFPLIDISLHCLVDL